jgi:hypothetical protein
MANPYFDKSKYKLGYAHELKGDKRLPKFKKQRKSWGFDETELWSLDETILKFLIPRLLLFQKLPGNEEGSIPNIGEMIECFQHLLDNLYDCSQEAIEVRKEKRARGFHLLGESMGWLWF